jgi:biopolymer transport protein ExbB/TolQ
VLSWATVAGVVLLAAAIVAAVVYNRRRRRPAQGSRTKTGDAA